ncbi:SIS domain-containing protein, partial [Candidatus Woesearchaeota archaeon]|nr:SIS domain-containing protein [Candidatus Woesearchaeota archaeon]
MTNRDLVDEFAIVDEFTRRYYFPKVIAGLMNIDEAMIEEASEKVALRIREGRRIFGFGNGGSEAISDAFIYALEQRISPAFQFDTYSNPKLPEVTDSPNSKLFHHRILRSGRKGDLAVLISASGNSNNINEISRLCRQKGVETVSVSGDGRITNNPKTKAGLPIVIPLEDQQTLEDVTLGVVYLISELVQYKIEGKKYDVS